MCKNDRQTVLIRTGPGYPDDGPRDNRNASMMHGRVTPHGNLPRAEPAQGHVPKRPTRPTESEGTPRLQGYALQLYLHPRASDRTRTASQVSHDTDQRAESRVAESREQSFLGFCLVNWDLALKFVGRGNYTTSIWCIGISIATSLDNCTTRLAPCARESRQIPSQVARDAPMTGSE